MTTIISVENLSKSYRLGQIGTGTLTNDLKVWWARTRGKPNPLLKIGQTDHGNQDGETLWALHDVSFTVQQGEVLGVIGRNGAGKSTLLKILSRVTAPTGGCVKVKGRIASLLEVGTGFHPELTGRENIYLNGAILGMTKQEIARKFDEIVAFAEVEKFIDTPVKRYSSGMYVRLAFAVAAHLESEILLVDEVLAVGDAEFQKKCLGKMGDVATNEGRTVLFVSHNMGAVSNLCKNGILINHGTIEKTGFVEDVVYEYNKNNLLILNDSASRPRKDCTNRIMLSEIELRPPEYFDSELRIIFSYRVNDIVNRFSIEWFVKDVFGQRILSALSVFGDNTWFYPIDSLGKVTCVLPHWRYPGGQYSLSVIFCNPGLECMDFVENAVVFTIGDLSPKDSKFIFTAKYGVSLPAVRWHSDEKTIIKVEQ